MSTPGGYEPVGGWSGQIVAGAPEPAPVAVAPIPATDAVVADGADLGPSFLGLVGALFVADIALAFFGAFTAFYWLVVALAGIGTYGETAGSVVANLVWIVVTVPLTRGLLQLLLGWRANLLVLGA